VLAAIAWIGGVITLGVLNARVVREKDQAAMATLARQGRFFGQAVIGPAAGVTLVAGVVMVVDAGMSFATLWIAWGLAGVFVSLLLGATLIRRTGDRLSELAPIAAPGDNESDLAAAAHANA
jgi:uncharacterized membrane protein